MNQTALASINLRAILRTLEKLPELDPKAKEMVQHKALTIQFKAAGVGAVRLKIGDGNIRFFSGAGVADMSLGFPLPVMVNKMFDGKGIPVPLKGITRLKYLTGTFTELTDLLSYYLLPTTQLLADPQYARINSLLTMHVAGYAMAEIANYDPKGISISKEMTNGTVGLKIENGPALTLVMVDHHATVIDGDSPAAAGPDGKHAFMVFKNLDVTGQVLRGELASYPAIGRELIRLGGYVPLLDNMNKILGLVPFYLS